MDDRTPGRLSPSGFGGSGDQDNFEPIDMENSDDDARSMSEATPGTPGGGDDDDHYHHPKPPSTINQDSQLPSTPQQYSSETYGPAEPDSQPTHEHADSSLLTPPGDTHLTPDHLSKQHQSPHQHLLPVTNHHHSVANDSADDKHHSGKSSKHHQNHSETTTSSKHHHHHHHRSQPSKRCIQVLNVSPLVTLEQITTLFDILGDIDKILLYPSDGTWPDGPQHNFKVCFIEFAKASSALVALHLTNTVFVDRALIVLPYNQPELPADNHSALQSVRQSDMQVDYDPGFTNQVVTGVGGAQFIATIDPRLVSMGLSQYPPLPINTEPARLEEIRRTVYVGNLDSTIHPDQVLKFFNDMGEVKYIRIAGDETQPTRFAFVEFTHQSSIAAGVQHNGCILGSRALKINHSNNAIVKPQPKIEIEDSGKSRRDRRSRDRRNSGRRDRSRDRSPKDRYRGRRVSPYSGDSRSRARRSSDREISPRRRSISRDRRSRSRDRARRRSRSPRDKGSRRSRSREDRRRRGKNNSDDRSGSKRHKSHR